MAGIRRNVFLSIVAMLLMLQFVPMAMADILDQVNDPITTTLQHPTSPYPKSLWQSFTPTLSTLTAVDVRVKNDDSSASHTVIVKIRDGSPSGSVLGSESLVVPYNSGTDILLHVDFSPHIALTPGSTYLIEIEWDTSDDGFVWWRADRSNPYAGGNAFWPDGSPDTADLNFRTWGPDEFEVPEFGAPLIIVASMTATALLLVRNRLHLPEK